MSQFSQRLIFGEKDVLLQDFRGTVLKTFKKSDFLTKKGCYSMKESLWGKILGFFTKKGCYSVTESLLGKISGKLLIEINVPIEVEVTFEAQINANVKGAKAHANAPGAEAHANAWGAEAYANADGAEAHADVEGAKAYANAEGAIACVYAPGALAIPLP